MDMQLGNLNASQKDELMDTVKQQIAVANAQELLTVKLLVENFFASHFSQMFLIKFTENDREMFQKVHWKTRHRIGFIRTGNYCSGQFDRNRSCNTLKFLSRSYEPVEMQSTFPFRNA
jgi:hypothetical protein